MNRITLRFLFFTGLAAIFCASCSKVEQLFPESFERNDKPFSVEAVPPEGCDSITLYHFRKGDTIGKKLDYKSDSLRYNTSDSIFIGDSFVRIGDSLVLTAWSKNGYTFINWICDGSKITNSAGVDISTQPVYGFKVKEEDIIEKEEDNKKLSIIKHHYEARFGLDYALQVIPPIDSIIPPELIKAMGNYLYFGDTPPKIDFCFTIPQGHLFMDTIIRPNPTEQYGSGSISNPINLQYNTFIFERQHRCVAESHYYERCNWEDGTNSFYYYANVSDSIFIMGHDNCFTAYFHQTWRAWKNIAGLPYLDNLTRRESVILSGKIYEGGIKEFHWGMHVDSYDYHDNLDGQNAIGSRVPGIHDILIMSSDSTIFDPTFQKRNFD